MNKPQNFLSMVDIVKVSFYVWEQTYPSTINQYLTLLQYSSNPKNLQSDWKKRYCEFSVAEDIGAKEIVVWPLRNGIETDAWWALVMKFK